MGNRLQRWFFLMAAMVPLCASPGPAWSAADCRDGQAWSGTIGDVPVMMEFDHVAWDNRPVGRYYYRQSLEDLILTPDPDKKDWRETDADGTLTGRLTVSCDEKTLTGTWTSPDGKKTNPIHAEAAKEYSKPRLDGMKVQYGPTRKVGSHRYDVVRVAGIDGVNGVRLLGDGAGISKINQAQLESFRSESKAQPGSGAKP